MLWPRSVTWAKLVLLMAKIGTLASDQNLRSFPLLRIVLGHCFPDIGSLLSFEATEMKIVTNVGKCEIIRDDQFVSSFITT